MKPLSGLSTARFSFFVIFASDAESVRAFTTVPPTLSTLTTESLHARWSKTERVSHPERSSLAGPPAATGAAVGTHFPVAAWLAVQTVSERPAGRRETEYISAANDDTATARSNSATSSSPITKP
jgi:hypothetical protein